MSRIENSEGNVLKRVAELPLISSALQQASSIYTGVKGRYPLLGFVGGVAELGIRSASTAALKQAAPLLKNLEPEIEAVNSFALGGLEQLEKLFPILQQPTDEVVANLKDAFFLRLDDAQTRVNDELDRAVDRWDKLLRLSWRLVAEAQDSAPGRVITAGLDELITQSEAAVAYYLPLPPTLRCEWERRVQSYEDEDEDDDDEEEEPRMWTRIRSLLLCLYLQLYHRLMMLRERLDGVLQMLGAAAETVGLTRLMAVVESLLQLLLSFYTTRVHRVEELRSLLVAQLASGIQALKVLPPVEQILTLPTQARTIMNDLLELGQILIQLLINTTPLYDLVKQVSDLDAPSNPIPEEPSESPSRRASANNLFLKAMDSRPRRRRSLYARSRRESASGLPSSPVLSPTPTPVPANGRKGSLKLDSPHSGPPELDTLALSTTDMIRRRSSATEVLLAPIMQLVTQSQRAFEFLSSGSSSEDQVIPVVETTEY
ncbi:perilipin 6 [Puntigrus tetrazona]|uniref:perilipin 6 n=1 Tax=Puntigrus tetrazona TaxID=1606681 RepID=UPI001C89B764|nr:perilipin 6 [Puntigrus tetrazona]XP_043116110.1 perilipin 6 [Puntigrus tetrazona]XP_043116111.1 perilipin 6 [Puntigrus tetrazona]